MGKKFKNRKQPESSAKGVYNPNRQNEKPWESIAGGHRGAQKYSRTWSSGYNTGGR